MDSPTDAPSSTSMRNFTSRPFVQPRVVLSQCLELEACRHDGQRIRNSFVNRLLDHVEVVPVCPEVAIGLGTPRDTIRLVDEGGNTRLVQPKTERNLTEAMTRFAHQFLETLGPVDGFVLKSGSPSCGTKNIKVYARAERSPSLRTESGLFARHVLERFDHLAVEDEGRLRNFDLRHHFLTQLYSLAELRALGDEPSIAGLIDMQRRYKHLLLLYDEPRMRELGKIVANHQGLEPQEAYQRYRETFCGALSKIPDRKAHSNVLMHMYGHFKDRVSDAERGEFFQMLEEVRDHHLPLNALLTVIRTWCARFQYHYLADQSYLEPYPRALLVMRDSGKGVDAF